MSALSHNFANPESAVHGMNSGEAGGKSSPICPACAAKARDAATERYGNHELFCCDSCGLHFWEPRVMPDVALMKAFVDDAFEELKRRCAAKAEPGVERDAGLESASA